MGTAGSEAETGEELSPTTRSAAEGLRVALLGAGYISNAHLLGLRGVADARVVAVCDRNATVASSLASRWAIPGVFDDADEMLRETRPDAVHVLLPPGAHADAAVQCLEAGAHVFVEKPFGLSLRDCERVAATAARAGLRAGVNHNQRRHPAFQRLLRAVRERRLGRVEHVVSCFSMPLRQLSAGQHGAWMLRSPGNILYESGPHPLSQIVELMGAVERASCLVSGRRVLNTGAAFFDTWQVSLECERGTAQLSMQFGRDCMDVWVHVIGQDGAARADLRRNTLQLSAKTRFMEPVDNLLNRLSEANQCAAQGVANFRDYVTGFLGWRPQADAFHASMAASIRDFYGAIRRPDAVAQPHDGVLVARACELILRSAEESAGHELRVSA